MATTDMRAFVDALAQLGYETDLIFASIGVNRETLNDPDARIGCEALTRVLQSVQARRFTPNLALEIARRTPIGSYPLLDYLTVTSDDVAGGVTQLQRYFQLVDNPVGIDVHEDSGSVRVELSNAAPFGLEYTAALFVLHFQTETNGQFVASQVAFQRQVDDVASYRRLLGCPVEENAGWNGLRIARESWRLPLRRRDPVLRRELEARANDVLARLPRQSGFTLEIQRALSARVAGGDTSAQSVAHQFAMSARTLQRKLLAEGVTYRQLVEAARGTAAARYVSESALAIGEIAYLLGYSEPAPFHRAFKRWHGVTPDAFRRSRRK